jgi:hypothetical protein
MQAALFSLRPTEAEDKIFAWGMEIIGNEASGDEVAQRKVIKLPPRS